MGSVLVVGRVRCINVPFDAVDGSIRTLYPSWHFLSLESIFALNVRILLVVEIDRLDNKPRNLSREAHAAETQGAGGHH